LRPSAIEFEPDAAAGVAGDSPAGGDAVEENESEAAAVAVWGRGAGALEAGAVVAYLDAQAS
jgi:hypothetical protein